MRARSPLSPLRAGWVIVNGLPVFHRSSITAGPGAGSIVHVHGFGVSGTYLEPTAARLADRFRTFVPDLPGTGRSMRPDDPLDLPGLARALIGYCDVVGVERATFVGNSLGCQVIVELASAFPERIDRAVMVSPAGGPNNRPLIRALGQLALDGLREPPSMLAVAARDYLRFGVVSGVTLFRAMMRYPTLDRISSLVMPVLVVVGRRDPLVSIDRVHVLADLPDLDVVVVPGAHALNYTAPTLIAELVEAHIAGDPLKSEVGPRRSVEELAVSSAGAGADRHDFGGSTGKARD